MTKKESSEPVSYLSYNEALAGLFAYDDIEGLVGVVTQHKNGGAIRCRLPSYIVVTLIDEIKSLRERVGGYEQKPDVPDVDEE